MAAAWHRRLARALLLAAAAGVLIEAGLRLASLVRLESDCFISDPITSYRLRPGSSCASGTANSLGFPDDEPPPSKPAGVTRIALVGDSFVVGSVQRDKTLAARLRQHARDEGRPLEVLSLGLPYASPRTYARVMQATATPLQIDMFCVVWFLGDDVLQSHPDIETRLSWRSPRSLLRSPFLVGASLDYSYLVRAARGGWRWVRDRRESEPDVTYARETFLSIERQRLSIFARSPGRSARSAYAGAVTAMQAIVDEARAAGTPLVIVLAPDEIQVDPALADAVMVRYGLDPTAYDFERPARVLAQPLDSRGIRVIDLTPALRQEATSAPVYLKQNTHWNALGNQVAAEEIWRALR